jgi:hypothetical protein
VSSSHNYHIVYQHTFLYVFFFRYADPAITAEKSWAIKGKTLKAAYAEKESDFYNKVILILQIVFGFSTQFLNLLTIPILHVYANWSNCAINMWDGVMDSVGQTLEL